MEWNKTAVLKFLQLYRNEPIIWNPKHPLHKNKLKVHHSWIRISATLNMPVRELKSKINSLRTSFRSHRRRKLASIQSGAGHDDIYQPIWFAYQMMEDFLGPVYNCGSTINTVDNFNALNPHPAELQSNQKQAQDSERPDDQYEALSPHTKEIHHNNTRNNSKPAEAGSVNERQKRLQLASEIEDAKDKMQKTFDILNYILSTKKGDDECELYCKLLAKKLREYSTKDRRLLMHKINGLLLKIPSRSAMISSCSYSSPSCAMCSPKSPLKRRNQVLFRDPNSSASALLTSPPNIPNRSSPATPHYCQFHSTLLYPICIYTSPHEDGNSQHSENTYAEFNNAAIDDLE